MSVRKALKETCRNLNSGYIQDSYYCLDTKLCLTLLRPHGLQPTRLLCSQDFPGKNTRVGCHFLLQGIFLTLGSNPCLLRWQADSLPLSHYRRPNLGHSHKQLLFFFILFYIFLIFSYNGYESLLQSRKLLSVMCQCMLFCIVKI